MAAPFVLGMQDLIREAVARYGGSAEERNYEAAKSAVQEGYRELTLSRNFRYFMRESIINLDAVYSTGTVAYTSSSRALTLTTGTWPTWAVYGTVRIASVSYQIQTRDSGSQLTLDVANCPDADIASGTSYVIYRNVYTLPSNFRAVTNIYPVNVGYPLTWISPSEWQALDRNYAASGTPVYFTLMAEPGLIGSMALHIYPYPSTDATLKFVYQRSPRDLVYGGYETGSNSDTTTSASTVASTAASASITGTSTAFLASHVGSLIRFSSDGTTIPDGRERGNNPWLEQKVIASRSSATAITTDTVMANTLSGVKYTITDPVDIHPTMINVVKAAVRWKLAEMKNDGPWERYREAYDRAYIKACEADNMLEIPRGPLMVPASYYAYPQDVRPTG